MKDFMNWFSVKHALGDGADITATTHGDSIDVTALNGGNDALCFIVDVGVVTDGTHTLTLEDSIDGGTTWVTVAAPYLQVPSGQSNVVTNATAAKTIKKFGYLGNANVGTLANSVAPTGGKVLVRITDTVATATTGGYMTAVAVLGYPFNLPAA
ncbi:hypothetical protein ccbrp13_56440 [Ktedonobacteria bacterium brp13]|nr:hypothetical protein ccbrp13_56440 [Ktedonobacteria bacterium brp13]